MSYDREDLVIARQIMLDFNKSVGWIDIEIDKIDNPPDYEEELRKEIYNELALEYDQMPSTHYYVSQQIMKVLKGSRFWKDPEDAEVGW